LRGDIEDMEDKSLTKAKTVLRDSWPQPFKRSPLEDGILMAFLPFKLGVHIVKGVNAEVDRATDELSRLRDMLESEED